MACLASLGGVGETLIRYTGVMSQRRMSKPTGSNGQQYTTLVVSPEYRDKIRVAKAEDGLSYEEYLARHLPVQPES